MYLGSWKVDDLLTFPANTHAPSTGAATDADAVPAFRIYEDETGTAILTGNMAKLDDANTTGFYSEQITLSAANGFEKGKCYTIYIAAAVGSVTGTMAHTFQIEAEVDSNTVSGNVPTVTTVTNLTNAPTNGDLTNTMKTSVMTAATAATPTAAAVTGAVGSVSGNVGGNVNGNVVGSVGSVTAGVTLANNAVSAAALATDAVTELIAAVFANDLESGKTFAQAILDLWATNVGDATANDADDPTTATFDSPDGTVQVTHNMTGTTRTKV